MDWAIIAQLIVTIGVPATQKLIEKWSNGAPVSLAEFAEVRSIAEQTATDRMKAQLVAAGIELDSAPAKALLGLTE